MEPEKQEHNTQRDVLGRFVIGTSGNPGGRPKGAVSIKQRIRDYLEAHPEEVENIVEHFTKENRELMWQMLEGRPSQQVDLGVDKTNIAELTEFFRVVAKKPNDGTTPIIGTGDQPTGLPDGPKAL